MMTDNNLIISITRHFIQPFFSFQTILYNCSQYPVLSISSEFLKNDKNLYPYNCEKKEEFIKKGVGKILIYLHFFWHNQ